MDKIIDEATMNWLLEKENPSVRYHALTMLLGMGESDPEVVQSRRAIMESGIVPKILELQKPGGYWGDEKKFYLDKYSGTVWQLLILAELAADPGDARIRSACSFILEHSQDRESIETRLAQIRFPADVSDGHPRNTAHPHGTGYPGHAHA